MFTEALHAHSVEANIHLQEAWRTVRVNLHEAICALRGHDYLLHRDADRLCLQCADCGHETPGWRIDVVHRRRLR